MPGRRELAPPPVSFTHLSGWSITLMAVCSRAPLHVIVDRKHRKRGRMKPEENAHRDPLPQGLPTSSQTLPPKSSGTFPSSHTSWDQAPNTSLFGMLPFQYNRHRTVPTKGQKRRLRLKTLAALPECGEDSRMRIAPNRLKQPLSGEVRKQ